MLLLRPLVIFSQWIFALFVWGVIAVILTLGWFFLGLPDIDEALKSTRPPTITLVSQDGETFASKGHLYGSPVTLSKIPKALIQAVLATEDRRFFNHFGVDVLGILRAIWKNFQARGIVQGGSTLTQQVAKNLFLTPVRSIKRKAQELILALWLEYRFSKKQILTIYLNRVYLGAGTYGVNAASQKYFNKPVSEISTYQSALLAGLLKAPSRYNPYSSKKRSYQRTTQVLNNMVAAGYLTKEQSEIAKAGKKAHKLIKPTEQTEAYFADWVLPQVTSYVSARNRDLIISTTMNARLQRKVSLILKKTLHGQGIKKQIGNGAVIVMGLDGAVLAMVGGGNYGLSQFNRVTQARRQPGSAFKPIVFLSGLEAGLTPNTLMNDAPIDIGGWQPDNFDKKFRGKITLKEALKWSINSVAVRVAKKVGPNRIIETAKRLGIVSLLPADLSLALGTGEISLMELAAAYAPFANGGYGVLPFGIDEIKGSSGEVLYRRKGSGPGRVMTKKKVKQMKEMLSAVIESGTGRQARLQRPAGGKTGTSQNYRDAWFLGFTANQIAGVWLGNDNGASMKGVTGGSLPALVWKDVMVFANNGMPEKKLTISLQKEITRISDGSNNQFGKNIFKKMLDIFKPEKN